MARLRINSCLLLISLGFSVIFRAVFIRKIEIYILRWAWDAAWPFLSFRGSHSML